MRARRGLPPVVLVGVTGAARSGKTTFAQMLAEEGRKDCASVDVCAFATPLKHLLSSLTGLPENAMETDAQKLAQCPDICVDIESFWWGDWQTAAQREFLLDAGCGVSDEPQADIGYPCMETGLCEAAACHRPVSKNGRYWFNGENDERPLCGVHCNSMLTHANVLDRMEETLDEREKNAVRKFFEWRNQSTPTVRQALQFLGTECFREVVSQKYWTVLAGCAIWEAHENGATAVIFHDCRFKEDAILLATGGAGIYKITRPSTGAVPAGAVHASEQGFVARVTLTLIQNDGDLNCLRSAAHHAWSHEVSARPSV